MNTAPEESPTIGRYRLLAELGRGGMANVFLAMAVGPAGFNKLVVLKQIRSELADDPSFVAMFFDEARLAAKLNHPNVVQTNEVGASETGYYIAMEYLEGQPLNRIMTRIGRGRGPLTLGMQLAVLVEALSGLHYAHEVCDFDGTPLGIVHRDMSPHNIFVTYSGQVKVMDFGIAKAMSSSTETRSGMLKGKVAYMAPEQAAGRALDHRADVFSVGVLLLEMAAGRRPLQGVGDVQALSRLLSGDVPRAREVAPDLDPDLEAIIDRAMAPNPEDRYPHAAALARDVDRYLQALGQRVTTRDVGQLVAEHFAGERATVQSLIEQMQRNPASSPGMRLPTIAPHDSMHPLGRTGQNPAFSQSNSHPSYGRSNLAQSGSHPGAQTGTYPGAPPGGHPLAQSGSHPSASSGTYPGAPSSSSAPPSYGYRYSLPDPNAIAAPPRLPAEYAPHPLAQSQPGFGLPMTAGGNTVASVSVHARPASPPPGRGGWLWVGIAAVFLSVGGVFAVLYALSTNGTRADEAAGTTASLAAPARTYSLRIESTPAGASVREEAGAVIGVTPLDVKITPVAGEAAPTYLVEHEGFEPYRVSPGVLAGDLTVRADLNPIAPAASVAKPDKPPASKGAGSKIKPPPGEVAPPPPPPVDIRLNR